MAGVPDHLRKSAMRRTVQLGPIAAVHVPVTPVRTSSAPVDEPGSTLGWVSNGSDEWSSDGPNILSPDQLETIKRALEQTFVILEHRFYYGSRAPKIAVFADFEELEEYLQANARPGDSIWCWRYDELCRDDNSLVHGKIPDDQGRTPRGGAY